MAKHTTKHANNGVKTEYDGKAIANIKSPRFTKALLKITERPIKIEKQVNFLVNNENATKTLHTRNIRSIQHCPVILRQRSGDGQGDLSQARTVFVSSSLIVSHNISMRRTTSCN
jgi:GR25 family glycosyltransferase involved in LPS biosynthesis